MHRNHFLVLLLLWLTQACSQAQTTWSQSVLPGAPLPSDLLLQSNANGQGAYEFTLGAGGSLARIRALQAANRDVIPFGTSITESNWQWGLMAGNALDDGNALTDDRFYLRQTGGLGQRLAPVMQIEKNATTGTVDVYSVTQDQWNSHLRSAVDAKISHLTRYQTLSDGSIKVRHIIRVGNATVQGAPFDISTPYWELSLPFPVSNYNRLAERLQSNGSPQTFYAQGSNIPQNTQMDVTSTSGYAVLYHNSNAFNSSIMGIVFGKSAMSGGNQMIVNYSDNSSEISVRPGIRLLQASPGAVLDITYHLVPSYTMNATFVSRLNDRLNETPVPTVYSATHAHTGEMATIVSRLEQNLSLSGIRTDRLGHDVTPAAIVNRPMLLNGPENDADIRERLAVFPQNPESLLQNYLYGTAAQKQSANNSFFRYPGNGDGNGLRSTYTTEMGRALMWDMYRYDIALGLGYATESQKQTARNLAIEYMSSKFTNLRVDGGGGGNLDLEMYVAMGLAGLNFPEHPDSQLWISRSVSYVTKFLNNYFPDGAGTESPRYHDWSLELLGKYLRVMQRRLNFDLYDHPSIKSALEWFIRFSSPPLSVTSGKMVTPAWGDSTYSSNGGSHYYYDLSIFAPFYRERDPDFSARLQDWWVRNGRPRQVFNAGAGSLTNILLLDPRLPTVTQKPNVSTYSPRLGMAALRAGTGDADEFFATFKCGVNGGVHSDADMGHIDLFAFGVPLALDSTSGPYVSGTTFNETVQAHNTVRFNGTSGSDTASGSFSAFGTSAIADYVAGGTGYGTFSRRHVLMMKGDYMVVWDETTASQFADWFFHVPGNSTLEWHPRKVVSKTPWNVDLDVHFVLPSTPLIEPTLPGRNISTSTDPNAVRNMLASESIEPTIAGMFTTMGESRFGDGSSSRNPFPFQWLKYFSVRNAPDRSSDFLTILHPRKTGLTPELTHELISASSNAVSLRVSYQGRTDLIEFTSSGVKVTKGNDAVIQMGLTWPQSGIAGAASMVKADLYNNVTTTISSPLTTTGPLEVHSGTLALGNHERIPDSASVMVKPSGIWDINGFQETIGTLVMNGGTIRGQGSLTASSLEWWGGSLLANTSIQGNFIKKGGLDWSRPANLLYTGDTIIEKGQLRFTPASTSLSGTGVVQLRDSTGISLQGTSANIQGLQVNGTNHLSTGTSTLSIAGQVTGSGLLVNSGSLNLTNITSIASTVSLQTSGLLTLPNRAITVKRLIINGIIQKAGVVVNASTHPGFVAGSGSITALEDIPVPSGLRGTSSLGKIELTWNATAGVTGYSVRRATISGGAYSEIATTANTSFIDTNVTDGVTYYYVVASKDASGTSANSTEIAVLAIGPWYFDPDGATAGSVAHGGSYQWISNSWTKAPGGNNPTEGWGVDRHAHFAASNPGTPLAYDVSLTNFSGNTHAFKSLRVAQGQVTFSGTPSNFYFREDAIITADASTVIRFAQTGNLAFNLNRKNLTFDGAGTTLVSEATVINNLGSITKTGTGTLVLASANLYNGRTNVHGGVLRLAVTDAPMLWLDATKTNSLIQNAGVVSQWNDANQRGSFASQSTAINRPTLISDPTLTGPAKNLIDFGSFSSSSGRWMQFHSSLTDIRTLYWVGKTTNENFLLGGSNHYDFHSNGAGGTIWNTTWTSTSIRNGTTKLNDTIVNGSSAIMPNGLVRLGVITTGNVRADFLARDRTTRYGGIQPGEILIFNSTLTTQQQADIEAYLAKKWLNSGNGIGNRLPLSTVVSLRNGAVLDLSGINYQELGGLESNDQSDTRVQLGSAELIINSDESTSFDGLISGTGGLRKQGRGEFSLLGQNDYSGPTTVEGGTLTIDGRISSSVTVKNGAILINWGSIEGNVIIEDGGIYLGDGNITGTISTPAPSVTITSPTQDQVNLPQSSHQLHVSMTVDFNQSFGTPAVTWSQMAGPAQATIEMANARDARISFPQNGTYTIRATAEAMVNGSKLTGFADRIIQVGGSTFRNVTSSFRQGVNSYQHLATFIRGDSPTWNSGARDQMLIGRNNGGMRGLFAFDLSSLPQDANVTSANFDLWIAQTGLGVVNAYELRPVIGSWTEGTGSSSTSSTVGTGSGADWNSRTGSTSANLWAAPGGLAGTDFSNSVLGSLGGFDTTLTAVGTKCSFTLLSAFMTEVQASITQKRPMQMMLTMSSDTSSSNRFARFASDDHANVEYRPQLTLTYTTGVPSLPQIVSMTTSSATAGTASSLTSAVIDAENVSWSLVSGPGQVTWDAIDSTTTQATFSQGGSYLIRLTAQNARGLVSRTITWNVAEAPALSAYIQSFWPNETNQAIISSLADPNLDGESNLIEFATGQNPTINSRATEPLEKVHEGIQFTYQRSRTAAQLGYQYTIEYSDHLSGTWIPIGPGELMSDGEIQTMRAVVPESPSQRRFLRLRVTEP